MIVIMRGPEFVSRMMFNLLTIILLHYEFCDVSLLLVLQYCIFWLLCRFVMYCVFTHKNGLT